MGNSQPVSNVETYRAGRCQSTEWLYLVVNNLLPHPLSAYRKEHSTVMLIASCLVRLIVSMQLIGGTLHCWDCWTSRPLSTVSITPFSCSVCRPIQCLNWPTSSSVDWVVPVGSHPADSIQWSTFCDTTVWSYARIRAGSTPVCFIYTRLN